MKTTTDLKLLEAIADISYIAGREGYYSGESRTDIFDFIYWAQMFEQQHAETDWEDTDYILAIEEYTMEKMSLSPHFPPID